ALTAGAGATMLAERDGLRARVHELEAEVTKLRGDVIDAFNGKDAPWRAVWEKLWSVGMASFIGPDGTGRGRALAFIDHLVARATRAETDRDDAHRLLRAKQRELKWANEKLRLAERVATEAGALWDRSLPVDNVAPFHFALKEWRRHRTEGDGGNGVPGAGSDG